MQLLGHLVWRPLAAVLQGEGLHGLYGSFTAASAGAGRVLPSVPVMQASSFVPKGAWPPGVRGLHAEQQHTSAGACLFLQAPHPVAAGCRSCCSRMLPNGCCPSGPSRRQSASLQICSSQPPPRLQSSMLQPRHKAQCLIRQPPVAGREDVWSGQLQSSASRLQNWVRWSKEGGPVLIAVCTAPLRH